jgi:predicted transcriptional regulator
LLVNGGKVNNLLKKMLTARSKSFRLVSSGLRLLDLLYFKGGKNTMEPEFKLTNAEARLAELLWERAPIASMELVRLAAVEFDWKKSTTFSVLKFLISKGLAHNENSRVTMLYTREEFLAGQSCRYVDESFGGSLPMFVAAFTSSRKLTAEQLDELKRLIDEHRGGAENG